MRISQRIIVSWLNRNVLAAVTPLRPFLELSLLHICWYLRSKQSSYKPYYDWPELDKAKGRPRFREALDYALNNLAAITLCQQNESEWLT